MHNVFGSDVEMYKSAASGVKSMNDMATSDGGALYNTKLADFLDSVKSCFKVVDANTETTESPKNREAPYSTGKSVNVAGTKDGSTAFHDPQSKGPD